MDHPAVAAALVAADFGFRLEYDDSEIGGTVGNGSGGRKPDEPAADDRNVGGATHGESSSEADGARSVVVPR